MEEQPIETDAAKVIESIRAQLHEKIEAGAHKGDKGAALPRFSSAACLELESLLKVVDSTHKEVGALNPRGTGPINHLIQKAKKLMQRSLTWYTRPLVKFQDSAIMYSYKIADIIDSQQLKIEALERETVSLSNALVDLKMKIEEKYPIKSGKKSEGNTPNPPSS